jgi:hypothetical protein
MDIGLKTGSPKIIPGWTEVWRTENDIPDLQICINPHATGGFGCLK